MMHFEDLRVFEERLSTMRAWSALDPEDKQMYLTLRNSLLGRGPRDDLPSESRFRFELQEVIAFVNRSPAHREERAIVVGLAIHGQFMAVNTWQLKNLIGRCKSSINGCFRSLGYLGFRAKGKSRQRVLEILPTLEADAGALRQWTARLKASSSSPSEGGSPITVTQGGGGKQSASPSDGFQAPWLDRTEGSGEEIDLFLGPSAAPATALRAPLEFTWSEEDTPH
jgi:hypothetical protein